MQKAKFVYELNEYFQHEIIRLFPLSYRAVYKLRCETLQGAAKRCSRCKALQGGKI